MEFVGHMFVLYFGSGWGDGGGRGGGGFSPSTANNLAVLGLRHTANVNLFPSIIQTRAIIDCKPSPET